MEDSVMVNNLIKAMSLRGYDQVDLEDDKISFQSNVRRGDTEGWVFQYNNWEAVRESLMSVPLWEPEEITIQVTSLLGLTTYKEDLKDMEISMTLEERYTKAMAMLGYDRIEDPVDEIAALAFKNNENGETIYGVDWELLGMTLENMEIPLNVQKEEFDKLIHPEGRISFFCRNLGGTGLGEDTINIIYPDFENAMQAYLSVETDGRMLGFRIGETERVIASFDTVDMQNHFVKHSTNSSFYDDLTVNEREYIMDILQQASVMLEKNNMYVSIQNSIHTITEQCVADISRQQSPWGAWMGHIANANRPQDYIDVDVMGYKSSNTVICNFNVIHANEVVSMKHAVIDVNPEDISNSIKEGMSRAMEEIDGYIDSFIEFLDTDNNYPMYLYSPYTMKAITDHYNALGNAGYEMFPSIRKGLAEMNTDEMKIYIENFFAKYDQDIICTSRVLDALANSVVKMIESGKIFHIEEEVDALLTKPSILSFIEQRTPLVDNVSEDVTNSVKAYFEEHLKDYTPIEICRASNYPDDHYLYAVIAKHDNGNYACWTSWNHSIKSMNYGHYALENREAAYSIIKENFNDISGEPEKYGPDKSMMTIETTGNMEETKSNSPIIPFTRARGR